MQTTSTPDLLDDVLKTTFGFQTFRPGQREAILTLLNHSRLLCIQPTGHGKSLLYQLPTCLLGGMTLVISPLLALMRDQIKHLNERFNIPAAAINSDQTEEENAIAKQKALAGKMNVLFIAPEQLDHIDRFAYLLNLDLRLIVVDEAHCISTWGHDFRPSYRQILHLLTAAVAKNPHLKILGLTATADHHVEEDIQRQLTLADQPVVVMRETMDRPNIRLTVLKQQGLTAKLAACSHLLSSIDGCGLIYCATRENVELVAEFLQLQKFSTAAYHAGFEAEAKKLLQTEFLADKYKALVATNALGMGIDKGNLRFIIHFDVPGSITAYYQEVGRCGRDGLPAQGFLLFDPADRRIQEYFIESALPSAENFAEVLQAIASAEQSPNLTTIKRLTGLHPTRVIIIIAELLEQGFLSKSSQNGIQVYSCLNKNGTPDLTRYVNQQAVKKKELQKMIHYGFQTETCRMALLRTALGDARASNCGHCDICQPLSFKEGAAMNQQHQISEWLKDRPLPISPMQLHKVSAGLSLLDSKVRSPLFARFMKERSAASSYQEMDEELIRLLLKHFSEVARQHPLSGIIPLPSRTWNARNSLLELLSTHFKLPIFNDLLQWKETPPQRQGELSNNDQRHHNVHQRMEAIIPPGLHTGLPTGTLILFDDYIGSGNTLREAARALRAGKTLKNALIPFTFAAVKWHLGKPGFS
jgi:ATP-dependent DNA helicase RecQ